MKFAVFFFNEKAHSDVKSLLQILNLIKLPMAEFENNHW